MLLNLGHCSRTGFGVIVGMEKDDSFKVYLLGFNFKLYSGSK